MHRLCTAALLATTCLPLAAQPRFLDLRLQHVPADPNLDSLLPPVAADFDADGRTDILLGTLGGLPVIRWGRPGGRFDGATTAIGNPVTFALRAAAGDVDGDGDLDLLFSTTGGFSVQFQTGRRRFEAGPFQPIGAQASQLALHDLDRDGDLDAVYANRQGLMLALNDGSGTFQAAPTGSLPTTFGFGAHIADLDGDGDNDLVVETRLERPTRLFLNDGTGRFTDATDGRLLDAPGTTESLTLGDFDGDGSPDLVRKLRFDDTPKLFLNDGSASFTESVGQLAGGRSNAYRIGSGDLDGDGTDDLVGFDRESLLVDFGRGDGQVFERTVHPIPGIARWFTPADLDGDGLDDVLAVLPGEIPVLALSNPDRTLAEAAGLAWTTPFLPTRLVRWADLDGDGDDDLVTVTTDPNDVRGLMVYANDGSGRFARTGTFTPSRNFAATDVAVLDVDADGDLDLLPLGGAAPDTLWIHDGRFGFTNEAATRLTGLADRSFTFAEAADLDRDGDDDLVVSYRDQGVLLQRADGSFDFIDLFVPPFDRFEEFTLGDIDGDGDQDVVTRINRYTPAVWLNPGDGRLTETTGRFDPVRIDSLISPHLVDLDGDGDLDCLWTTGDGLRICANDGDGTFTGAVPLPGVTIQVRGLDHADIDGDGDQDLALVESNGDVRIFVNDGTGQLTEDRNDVRSLATLVQPIALAFGDADGDGDPDLAVGNEGPDQLFTNRMSHLAKTHLPYAGDFLRLRAADRRGATPWFSVAIPVVSARRSHVDLGAAGRLWIDPDGALPGAPVTLPNLSFAEQEILIPIPADPDLVGVELFVQALFVHPVEPARLSGLVTARIR